MAGWLILNGGSDAPITTAKRRIGRLLTGAMHHIQGPEEGGLAPLIKHAHDDQWYEVVVMAAGHAPVQREEPVTGLLERVSTWTRFGVPDRSGRGDRPHRRGRRILAP
ncbi:hypothetical protein [Nocardiopsis listeri]|uniref:hypothetical protein n=1 Tax=Nocardiopsis listeri TaxID=53440 RepID=UPI00350E427D